ncbi:zinc finger protein 185 isoform X2 [Neoarius graeffei]|uniref:zinc finger protein 185 isoform X2 n=1 Tax=Neoarius graeffei TaxID=443677 RepID=UPI00298C887A|nr:zinc finger protein 185 isoform X2 [Neoarius graeffei]
MASDMERKTVFYTTKVRTALRNDSSWIRQSSEEPKDPQPPLIYRSSSPTPQSPTPQSPTPQSPTPQSPVSGQDVSPGWRRGGSYVVSAWRKCDINLEGTSGLTQIEPTLKPVEKTPEIVAPKVNAPVVETAAAESPGFETLQSEASGAEMFVACGLEQPVCEGAVRETPEALGSVSSAALLSSSPQTHDDVKVLCSFCTKLVESNVKISVNIPPITCHVDCFQCAACAKLLGDLMSSMFHHHGKIYSDPPWTRSP